MDELVQISKDIIGFGTLRVPQHYDGSIDIIRLEKLVHEFLSSGLDYFDTGYDYNNIESCLGKLLHSNYSRTQYRLAAKMPAWHLNENTSCEHIFSTQLKNLKTTYFDCYLLHAVRKEYLPIYDNYDCWNFCKRMRMEGKIRLFGISFHDSPELLDNILKNHPEIEFVQLQLNYLDWGDSVVEGEANYRIAEKYGKPVIAMEPLKGGILLNEELNLHRYNLTTQDIVDCSLKFLSNFANIQLLLCGFSSESQILSNYSLFKEKRNISSEVWEKYIKYCEDIQALASTNCTGCGYCKNVCPQNRNIPILLKSLYYKNLLGGKKTAKRVYLKGITEDTLISKCLKCGLCEDICPQDIKIMKYLDDIVELFEEVK